MCRAVDEHYLTRSTRPHDIEVIVTLRGQSLSQEPRYPSTYLLPCPLWGARLTFAPHPSQTGGHIERFAPRDQTNALSGDLSFPLNEGRGTIGSFSSIVDSCVAGGGSRDPLHLERRGMLAHHARFGRKPHGG